VSAALLAVAVALLLWPAGGPGIRRVRPARGAVAFPALPDHLAPLAAGGVAVVAGAVLSTPLVAVLAGGCAALGARSVRSARRGRREELGLLALAEALGVLAAELSAGRPVVAALRTAAASCPDSRTAVLLVAALGADEAGPRARPGGTGSELERLRSAVRLSGTTGCPLAEVLAAVEGDLRARYRRLLELRAATAGPRAAAVLLAGLPVLGLAMGAGIGARPWSVLTTTPAGQLVLVTGVLLEVAGVAWVGRLLRRATADRHLAGGRDG
jgi:tight adherence protein B